MENLKLFYFTFGCKVNQYETENIKQLFEGHGCKTVKNFKDADVCIINSCTVTAAADTKLRQLCHKIKKADDKKLLAVCGCFTQAYSQKAQQMLLADIIVGANNKMRIFDLVSEYLCDKKPRCEIIEHKKGDKIEKMMLTRKVESKTRATIKIQDGCNRYCAYCIIPYARGVIRSKSIEDIKQEVAFLAKCGHKEIVLAGINLSLYGTDFEDKKDLADAVIAVAENEDIKRVRLSSLEPELITDEMIDKLASCKKLCSHFHLALQSGCDETLKRMNRHYTTAEYMQLVNKLRERFENCAFTTDIMVGFAGETDEEFQKTCEFVKKVGFSKCHIFPYSQREGTKACGFENQIDEREKEKRAKILTSICEKSRQEFLNNQCGKVVSVLFERENCTDFHRGYAQNYTLIKIKRKNDKKSLRHEILCVKIKEVKKDFCLGEIIEN